MSRISLDMKDGVFVVAAGPRDVDLVRLVSGLRHDRKHNVWIGPPRWSICLQLRGIFGADLEVSDAVNDFGWDCVQAEHFSAHLKAGTYRDNLRDFPWSAGLLDFQLDSVPLMSDFERVINGDEMGAGKTVQAARALVRMEEIGKDAFPALVVCTASMAGTWAEEASKWIPDANVTIVRGSAAKRRKIIEDARYLADPRTVLIITWGSLRMHTRQSGYGNVSLKKCLDCDPTGDPALKVTSCETHKRELNGGWIRTVIADEAHKACNPKAKQTRALWAVAKEARFRLPLTGTPVRNEPGDFWALLHLIDPEAWTSRSKFVARYALTYDGRGYEEVLGWNPETKPELDRLIEPYFICRPKSVIQPYLPPRVPMVRWATMEGAQLKAYESLAKDSIAKLDSGILTALDPLVVQTRLRQAACANLVLDEEGGVTAMETPSCKVDALLEVLDEMAGRSVVVFAESKLLLRLVGEKLTKEKISYVDINGDVEAWRRTVNIEKFQAGEVQVILVSLGAGAEGITLTKADTAIFLQRSWNMVANRQAEARIHRHGQTAETVWVIDIITADTIEEAVFNTAQDKEEVLQQLLKDPAWVKRAIGGKP